MESRIDPAGSRRVAVLWRTMEPNAIDALRRGIDTALYRHGYRSITMDLFSDEPGLLERDRDAMIARILEDSGIPGVLTAFLDLPESIAERMQEKGRSIVTIERSTIWSRKGNLRLGNGVGARLAAEALLELGRKRIAFVGPVHEHGCVGGDCYRIVEDVLSRHDGVTLIPVDAYRFERDTAAKATAALLDAHPDVDAIIFASDVHAIAGLVVLKERRRGVPHDVSVVSLDDSPAARSADPAISAVVRPFVELGRLAGEMLMGAVAPPSAIATSCRAKDGLPSLAPHHGHLDDITLPERLVLRGSCLRTHDAEIEYRPGDGMIERLGLVP